MKVFKNTVVLGYNGKPIMLPIGGTPAPGEQPAMKIAKLTNIFWLILNNAPIQTQQDSINGQRLAQALDAAKDTIEVEEGVHDWLKPIAEKVTPTLFRVNGNTVYRLVCEGFEKPHKPKEKEKAEEKN